MKQSETMNADDVKRKINDNYVFIIVAFVVIITVIALSSAQINDLWADVEHYYNNINSIFKDFGRTYTNNFEYPPFFIVFLAIPRLLSWDLQSFCFVYSIFALFFFLLGLYPLKKILDHFGTNEKYPLLMYVSLIAFAGLLLFCRNDVFATTLVLFSIMFFLEKKYVPASAILALATMTKIYPALLILIFIIPLISNKKWKLLLNSALTFVSVCVLISLPFIICDPYNAFDYLTYHSGRGIQVESFAGSILLMINIFVPGLVEIRYDQYQSHNLYGDITDPVLTLFTILEVFFVLGFAIWCYYRVKELDENEQMNHCVCFGCAILIMVAIVFNKVFSCQYMLWYLTLIPIAMVPFYEQNDRKNLLVAFVAMCVISSMSAFAYGGLTGYESTIADVSTLVIFIKNIIVLAGTAYMILLFKKYTDRKTPDNPVR